MLQPVYLRVCYTMEYTSKRRRAVEQEFEGDFLLLFGILVFLFCFQTVRFCRNIPRVYFYRAILAYTPQLCHKIAYLKKEKKMEKYSKKELEEETSWLIFKDIV